MNSTYYWKLIQGRFAVWLPSCGMNWVFPVAKWHKLSFGWWINLSADELAAENLIGRPETRMLYAPLKSHDTRLFVLLPGKMSEVIRGQVFTAKVCDNIRYEALSYVWGSISKWERIFIQDMTVSVTPSLALALRNLRLPDAPRVLWIDSICINQADIVEKNSQVRLMPLIYERARNVVIWLGEASHDSAVGIHILEYFASSQAPSASPLWMTMPPGLVKRGLKDIMNRDWFRRIWVVQEAALSQIASITCDPYSFSWWSNDCTLVRRFARMIKFAELSPDWQQADLGEINFRPLLELMDLQIGQQLDRSFGDTTRMAPDILDIAYDMRHRSSTDPRDKIFGLAGIVSDRIGGEDLRPDYTMSVRKAYEHLGSIIRF